MIEPFGARRRRTIKNKITLITVLFSLVIAVILASVSYVFFGTYARRSVVQSAEFNLRVLGGLIGKELSDFDLVTRWALTNGQILQWLAEGDGNPRLTLDTFDRLRDEFASSASREYVTRIIVASLDLGRFLQVGNTSEDTSPVTKYNLGLLGLAGTETPRVYGGWEDDPFTSPVNPGIFTVVRPVRAPGGGNVVGYVYLAVSANVLLERLRDYPLREGCDFFLTAGESTWRVEGNRLARVPDNFAPVYDGNADTLGRDTLVGEVRVAPGVRKPVVTCPLGIPGLALSQTVSIRATGVDRDLFAAVLAIILASMLAFGFLISLVLGRAITKPVLKIRRRLSSIAASDFARDDGIEWDNELGDIGRGINDMSAEIESLLETRVADERKKKDLEYRMLQSQVNPHFLYNTLASIKWMATIQGATGIAEMTTALARLMKNAIKESRTVVPLRDEIALLDDYYVIQRYRHGSAIRFEKDVEGGLLDTPVPCFALQPLMENSIFHGIEPNGGIGYVRLGARLRETGDVEITLEDDGVGFPEEGGPERASGDDSGLFAKIGIESVDMRIRHAFGERYGLRVGRGPKEGTIATLTVPGPGAAGAKGGE